MPAWFLPAFVISGIDMLIFHGTQGVHILFVQWYRLVLFCFLLYKYFAFISAVWISAELELFVAYEVMIYAERLKQTWKKNKPFLYYGLIENDLNNNFISYLK